MKNKSMTPRERVLSALRRQDVDMVPFTIYDTKWIEGEARAELMKRGLCPVIRITSYTVHRPNVSVKSHSFTNEKGVKLVRTCYSTPAGDLTTLVQPVGFTTWTLEHMFKTKEDYKALLYIIQDAVVQPDYEKASLTLTQAGDEYVVRDQIPLEPLQNLISTYMGTETFCLEWMDNRDEILKLYDAFVAHARKIYPIVAEGPLEFANYGGNVVPQIFGVENFEQYFVPHYNEAAEALHKKGKLLGTHLDADNSIIMNSIAKTGLDYIEAYDAGISPSVKEARKYWPDKVLWLNWPSAWHLEPMEKIKPLTKGLIDEAHPGDGFIIGITEDVPVDRIVPNMFEIMNGIEEAGPVTAKGE
ncbi:MAG TPA: hypothetical protein DDZ89_15115 [Clostridiales bacterium]|nr:hypothetical protein [Clostridiales bacterium]